MRAFAKSRARGFTLIELMVVLILFGIMTAMILPEMRGSFEDELLRSTGRKLAHVLNLAYSQSVSLNQTHRVRIDVSKHEFSLERLDREQAMGFVPVKEVPNSEGELDERITVNLSRAGTPAEIEPDSPAPAPTPAEEPLEAASLGTIRFYPDGTAEATEITLRDREGFEMILKINPTTSRVQIVPPARK